MTKPFYPRRQQPRTRWTDAQTAALVERYPHVETGQLAEEMGLTIGALHNKAKALGLRKTLACMSAICRKNYNTTAGQFPKGNTPWNAGMKGWKAGGRSSETQFKKGIVPANRREVGELRTNSEGYVDIKVAPGPKQWVPLHRYLWQQRHGETLGKDDVILFKDGNRHNFSIDNLQKINRLDLMRRNSIHNCGPEIAQIHQLRGAIQRQINKQKRNAA